MTKNMMWRKSSYTAANNECVELASALDRLRDSKNVAGPSLRADIAALITALKAGRFDG
ncbi:MAG: DUF397 domain-containing protein [Candidatus Dormibacteraceae bacterium]